MIPIGIQDLIRVLGALAFYTLLPGFVIACLLPPRRSSPRLGVARVGGWVGWSLVINALVVSLLSLIDGVLERYVLVVTLFNVVGLALVFVRTLKGKIRRLPLQPRDLVQLGLVLLIAGMWFGAILRSGPRIDYKWDQWFHIAHVREAAESNRIVPDHPFWPDVPLSETYGLWHALLAAVVRSAGVDVLVLWRIGNAYMAALGFIVIYAVAGAFLSKGAPRLIAATVFLGSGFGALQITRTSIYPWGISLLLMWISLGIFFQYLLEEDRWRLLSATAVGLVPALIHPQEYIFLCFGIFALGLSLVVGRRVGLETPLNSRRVWQFFALLILLGLPLMLLQYPRRLSTISDVRAVGSNASAELPLYQSTLARVLTHAFPYFWKYGLLKHTFFPFNFISLLILFLLPRRLDARVRWLFVTLAWAPTLAVLFPGLSWITQLVLKETYAWRLLNLIPTPFIWASIFAEGIAVKLLRREPPEVGRNRFVGNLGWFYFALIVVLIGGVGLYIGVAVQRDEFAPPQSTPLHAQAMFDTLDRLTSERATVLSDPETSYVVPGLTKHYVVLNEPSHGAPEDINLRFTEMRKLLSSPYQSSGEAIAALERYDVEFIVVNKLWLDQPFFLQMPIYSEYTLDFLRMNPCCFEPVYEDKTFAAFRFLGCPPQKVKGKGNIRPGTASAEEVQYSVQRAFNDELRLVGYSLPDHGALVPGRTLTVDLYWKMAETVREPYAIGLDVLCDYPGRGAVYGKLARRAHEWWAGQTFWVGVTAWLPIPPEGWAGQRLNTQTIALEIPVNLAPAACDLNLYVLERRRALREQGALPYWFLEWDYVFEGTTLHSFEGQDER